MRRPAHDCRRRQRAQAANATEKKAKQKNHGVSLTSRRWRDNSTAPSVPRSSTRPSQRAASERVGTSSFSRYEPASMAGPDYGILRGVSSLPPAEFASEDVVLPIPWDLRGFRIPGTGPYKTGRTRRRHQPTFSRRQAGPSTVSIRETALQKRLDEAKVACSQAIIADPAFAPAYLCLTHFAARSHD